MIPVMFTILIVKHLVRDNLNRTIWDIFIRYFIASILTRKLAMRASIPMLTGAPAAALTIDAWVDWSDYFIHTPDNGPEPLNSKLKG